MNLLQPLGLLWGLLAIPVIALYFLKLRRKKREVPSTWLWFRSMEDLRVNAPFQRLRKSLLLLLQLLLIFLGALALARPVGSRIVEETRGVVILLDRSASMAMRAQEGTRLEAARKAAIEVVDSLKDGDQVMVVAFGSRADVVLPFTGDRSAARRAIESIEPVFSPTRLTEAFAVAVSAALSFKKNEIVIVSDGGFEELAVPPRGVPVRFLCVGREGRNLAITGLTVRNPAGADDPWLILAEVLAFGKPETVPVELHLDGRLVSVKNVEAVPDRPATAVFEVRDKPTLVEVRLDTTDDLSADNRAWHVVSYRKLKVLLVTPGNFFLEKVLERHPEAETFLQRDKALAGDVFDRYDVVVIDRRLPEKLPEGKYFIVGAVPSWPGVSVRGSISQPEVVHWDRRHPVARNIDFTSLYVQSAPVVELPPQAAVVVEARETPLVFSFKRENLRAVCVPFSVLESDWPLRPSFPLAVANVLEYLGTEEGDWKPSGTPGEPIRVRSRKGVDQAEVTSPEGEKATVRFEDGKPASFAATRSPGLYSIRYADGTQEWVALNLFSEAESSVRVSRELRLLEKTVGAGPTVAAPPAEFWRAAAWGILALLLLEWFIYHRRVGPA